MSTTTLRYPNVTDTQHTRTIGLIIILILASLVLIASLILVIGASVSSSHQTTFTGNSIIAVPVQTAPNVTLSTETQMPISVATSQPSVVAVPVATPPSQ